jgi:uncharacterized phage protein (TIGR01671 family)
MIQFRAWDKTTSKLHVVNGIYCDNKKIHYIDDNRVRFVGFDNVIIMQSTGLKDDFDKEIFEGDVILWTYWDEFEDSGRAKVIFDKGMFKLLDIRTEKEVWDNLFDCIENCDVYLQGNIYENPELLEVKE